MCTGVLVEVLSSLGAWFGPTDLSGIHVCERDYVAEGAAETLGADDPPVKIRLDFFFA